MARATVLVNLCPHQIKLRVSEAPGEDIELPAAKLPARVCQEPGRLICLAQGVPVYSAPTHGAIVGLPPPREDVEFRVLYVASLLVAQAAAIAGRTDVVSPGTGPGDGAIRGSDGQIEAVTRLISWLRN
jgi:hypothetical protein